MSKIGGTLSFTLDGTTYDTTGSVTLEPGNVENEAKVGHRGSVHTKKTFVAPRFDATVMWTEEVGLLQLGQLEGVTCTWQLDNGKKYDFIGCTVEGRPSGDPVEGEITLPMFAESAIERT